MLDPNFLAGADRNKGRFRNFLHAVLKRYVNDERKKVNAQKRGGDLEFVAFDTEHAETRCAATGDLSPDEAFERQ